MCFSQFIALNQQLHLKFKNQEKPGLIIIFNTLTSLGWIIWINKHIKSNNIYMRTAYSSMVKKEEITSFHMSIRMSSLTTDQFLVWCPLLRHCFLEKNSSVFVFVRYYRVLYCVRKISCLVLIWYISHYLNPRKRPVKPFSIDLNLMCNCHFTINTQQCECYLGRARLEQTNKTKS